MKTVQTVQTVDSYLTNLVKTKKDGEITLDAIQKEFPMLPRNELIRQVREVNSGKFVIGRRGGASRFLYGAAILEKAPSNPVQRLVKQTKTLGSGQGFSLKIRLGDGAVAAEIPVNLELAAA